jgi:ribonuclease HI
MTKVKIYTDGSANNHTGNNGGYGIYIDREGQVEMYAGGQYINTTSARAELMGALFALKHCEPGDVIDIYMDNQYVVYSFQKRWVFKWEKSGKYGWENKTNNKKPFVGMRQNYDLLKQLLVQYRRLNHKVTFHWVKGHNETAENEICDLLADQGAHSTTIITDWHEPVRSDKPNVRR